MKKALKQKINDEVDLNLDDNIDRLLSVHGQLQTLLYDYDKKLIKVLEKHETDFLAAYKTHMSKVEKELMYLKSKAKD